MLDNKGDAMKIYLYLKNKIRIFTLPQTVSGSYNFDEDDESEDKLINIDAKNNKWILYSTEESKVIYNNQIVEELPLVPYSYYTIRKNNIIFVIYVENLVENSFTAYEYDKNINVVVGNSNNSTIIYKNDFEKGEIFQLIYNNDTLLLSKFTDNRLYLNNKILENTNTFVNPGDTINYYGFKILIILSHIIDNTKSKVFSNWFFIAFGENFSLNE